MEPKLFNHIRKKHILGNKIRTDNTRDQCLIEKYSLETGLCESEQTKDYFNRIQKYLADYNKFLVFSGKSKIKLRYYQILALFFTEDYFDCRGETEYNEFDTNSLAYWMATGSGKTIVMHLNILQYLSKMKSFDKFEIIITTPLTNLIRQHQREVVPFVEYLNKKTLNNRLSLVIDTTQSLLNREEDFKFNANNRYGRLILVDEAHIGLSGSKEGEFQRFRKEINKGNSFLFEYSATFHNLADNLEEDYQKSVIYDYSYKEFFKEGYGKDFSIKQISEDETRGEDAPERMKANLNENFLMLQEKLEIYNELDYKRKDLFSSGEKFPDKPLLAFMGNTVTGDNDDLSDIQSVIAYLARLDGKERAKYSLVFGRKHKGKLRLTLNRHVEDEILLSYGDGEYFGIVNIGGGDKFFRNFASEDVEKKEAEIINDKYIFENIDSKESPINILVGSRKFAEGWNCFRLSVIGLINLGRSPGNKIIQIFGRGVRLKGLNDDGKRRELGHNDQGYDILRKNKEDLDNQIKMLETLCVLSLKPSYLLRFTEDVINAIDYQFTFTIPVEPVLFKLGNDGEMEFDEYRKKLPIFKLAKKEVEYTKAILKHDCIEFEYVEGGKITKDKIHDFKFQVDYRTDKTKDGEIINSSLKNAADTLKEYLITEYSEQDAGIFYGNRCLLQIYSEDNGALSVPNISQVINSYADEIKYDSCIDSPDIVHVQNLIDKIFSDFSKKLNNRLNHIINSKNSVLGETIKQSEKENRGDFISEYTVTKSFDKKEEYYKYSQDKNAQSKEKNRIKESYGLGQYNEKLQHHIYEPVIKELTEQEKEKTMISPDTLNEGERKFIAEFDSYISSNFSDKKDYEFYLMRNVESLKSIGVYLEDDEQVFFPDFIFWIIDRKNKKTYLNLIDPKGITGTVKSGAFNKLSEKVKIGDKKNNKTLGEIESKLKIYYKNKDFSVNSFILLPESSGDIKNKDDMVKSNVFSLKWDQNNKYESKSWQEWIFHRIGIG